VYARQQDYYNAITESTKAAESTPFIEFMLQTIFERVTRKQITPEVTPEVGRMINVLHGAMTRVQIMEILGLKDEKHFRTAYQQAGIAFNVIEMTIPDKPNSRLQKYRLTPAGLKIQQNQSEGEHE
jgi:hypothetical protein